MSKNVKVNGVDYTGVSKVQLPNTAGGTALFKDVDEITTPSGTINITENGTHNVLDYAQAVVNVESGGGADDYEALFKLMITGGTGTEELVIPEGTKKIRANAFSAIKGVQIKMADSVEDIGDEAFSYSDGSPIDKLPANLKTIGARAFKYAQFSSDSTVLEIPQGVTTIGSSAFNYARGRSVLTFKGTPESIDSDALYLLQVNTINVPWAEGAVANAPWGATGKTINYNYTGA